MDVIATCRNEAIPAPVCVHAVSFVLLDDTKTLTDKQIDKMMQSFMSAFERELGAQIRK